MSIVFINITIITLAIISIVSILSIVSIVAIDTMPIVTVPVAICDAIVKDCAVFIFTELIDELRLQCWKKEMDSSVNLRHFTTCQLTTISFIF